MGPRATVVWPGDLWAKMGMRSCGTAGINKDHISNEWSPFLLKGTPPCHNPNQMSSGTAPSRTRSVRAAISLRRLAWNQAASLYSRNTTNKLCGRRIARSHWMISSSPPLCHIKWCWLSKEWHWSPARNWLVGSTSFQTYAMIISNKHHVLWLTNHACSVPTTITTKL